MSIEHAKKLAKDIWVQLIYRARLHNKLLVGAAVEIAFHRVNNVLMDDELTCSVEAFKRYCSFFSKYFHVVRLSDLVRKIEVSTDIRNRPLGDIEN